MYGMSPEMLSRMYVEGSLQNKKEGIVFAVKNKIDSGSISGIAKLSVDGVERPLEGATVQIGESVRSVSGISWSSSLYVPYGVTVIVYVPGTLEPGEHTISIQVNTVEEGRISIPIIAAVS